MLRARTKAMKPDRLRTVEKYKYAQVFSPGELQDDILTQKIKHLLDTFKKLKAFKYSLQIAANVARLFNSPCGLKHAADAGFVVRRPEKFVPKKGIRGCTLFRIANQHSV